MEKKHDYKDTIKEAAGLDEDRPRRDKSDSEFAFEALAVTAATSPYAQDETMINLLQLELAAQLTRRAFSNETNETNEKDDDYLD